MNLKRKAGFYILGIANSLSSKNPMKSFLCVDILIF